MEVAVYDIANKETEKINVPDALFATPWKPELVHQAIVTQQANSRQKTALAKDRSEVRGGGKKPWRQKGTGRARHGSIRSPLWIGGGVTHGPVREKSYAKKINKKMKVTALLSLISKKFNEGDVRIIEGITPDKIKKTKDFSAQTAPVRKDFKTASIITSSKDKQVFLASRNISKTACIAARSLNIVDIAKRKGLLITKQALPELVEHFITKKKES